MTATGGTPKKAAPTKGDAATKQKWLDAFREWTTVTKACDVVGIARTTVYRWKQRDEDFALAWHDVEVETTEEMEREARRRAVAGTKRVFYDKDGNVAREEQVYSDTLLIFLLKGRKPETYRDRVDHRHSGSVKTPLQIDLEKLSKDELDSLEKIAAKLEGG